MATRPLRRQPEQHHRGSQPDLPRRRSPWAWSRHHHKPTGTPTQRRETTCATSTWANSSRSCERTSPIPMSGSVVTGSRCSTDIRLTRWPPTGVHTRVLGRKSGEIDSGPNLPPRAGAPRGGATNIGCQIGCQQRGARQRLAEDHDLLSQVTALRRQPGRPNILIGPQNVSQPRPENEGDLRASPQVNRGER